ncbi:MAG: redoxin domain-containing protein [Dehalococcoidales bacterium]|nr:redoxin domain-containing protein [Dehalococcoidales bacterium]
MAQLRDEYALFVERKAEIIVTGPEDEKAFKEYWQREKMPFPGIPDPDHKIAGLYGQEVKILKLGRMPALYVIDREGRVRFKHHGKTMSDIPSNRKIQDILEQINQTYTKREE